MKNFIYIHTHDSGRYLSPYGYCVPTPNLQGFAEESLLFRQAYCVAPTCSPSRVGMLSGMAPHTSNMLGLAHRGFQMDSYDRHLVSYLNQQHFYTALCGIQHEAPRREMLGYQEILDDDGDAPGTLDLAHAKIAADFIKNYQNNRPFFLSFGMKNTHRPYPTDTGDINPDYVMPAFPLQDNSATRQDMAQYMRSVQIVDECVGIVLDALQNSGHQQDTIVLFTTDHGLPMPFMKCSLYDTGIGVSMILHAPGLPSMGHVTDSLVSHIDVFPTICDLLGLEKPQWLQGHSMIPILNDPTAEIRQALFAEINFHAAYEPARCIRTKDYKLIRYYDQHNQIIVENIDGSEPKSQLVLAGLPQKVQPREMLFDLRLDPMERENVYLDPRYIGIYRDLSEQLCHWMEQTDDPLLKHPYHIPAPANARVDPVHLFCGPL